MIDGTGTGELPSRGDIERLAMNNPIVYAAWMLHRKGVLNWEEMLTVLVVTMAKNIDTLEKQLAHAISSSGKMIKHE